MICLSRYLANKYGKKNTFVVCLSLTAFFTALFYIPSPTDVSMLFILNFMRSLAYAPTIPLLWAMIGDVADHIEYENHRRATGFCFSGIVLALKLGLGFGGAIAGIIISMFGYVSGDAFVQRQRFGGYPSGIKHHSCPSVCCWCSGTSLLPDYERV